jgi:hypothetical protein
MVSSGQLRIGALFLTRPGGAAAGAFLLLTQLGCMNFAVGNKNWDGHGGVLDHDGVLEQEGKVTLLNSEERDVYYPIPYASIPNLELTTDNLINHYEILQQKEDHFRVRNTIGLEIELNWHARGVRTGLLPAPPQPLVKSSPPDLPSQPVPAQ